MTTPQAITVSTHREVTQPKTHIEFKIIVSAQVRSWDVWRRYSEFEQLHDDLTQTAGSQPPCELPPKHSFSFFRTKNDPVLLEERRQGLERYLRSILASRDPKWRETFNFKDFLAVPAAKPAAGSTVQFTSSSWLDEQLDLQAAAREVRAETNKRDALAERGDVNGAHTANVQAKKKLAALTSRIGALTAGLATLAAAGMSEGEVQRRTDMLARLDDDSQKLSRIVIAAKSARTAAQPMVAAQARADRDELLSGSSPTARAFGSRPATRVFGGGGTSKPVAEENDVTRPLDNHGLVGLQQLQIDEQDQQLNRLSAILERQKVLGTAIGNEIAEQIEILDQLSNDVDNTQAKLQSAKVLQNRVK